MAKTTHNSAVAIAYASALLDLASEQKQAEPIRQELGVLKQLATENKGFAVFLSNPSIGHGERHEVLGRIFGTQLSQLMKNFLGVMNEKNRLGELAQVADAYSALLDEQLGKIEVDVTVASKLNDAQMEEVRKRVSAALKKDAVVTQHVDDSIIGGLVVRVQDRLIDASVRTQLDMMKQQLLAGPAK